MGGTGDGRDRGWEGQGMGGTGDGRDRGREDGRDRGREDGRVRAGWRQENDGCGLEW